jgi:hypothetical protein
MLPQTSFAAAASPDYRRRMDDFAGGNGYSGGMAIAAMGLKALLPNLSGLIRRIGVMRALNRNRVRFA